MGSTVTPSPDTDVSIISDPLIRSEPIAAGPFLSGGRISAEFERGGAEGGVGMKAEEGELF